MKDSGEGELKSFAKRAILLHPIFFNAMAPEDLQKYKEDESYKEYFDYFEE